MVLLSSSLAALSIYWRTASELGEARTRREAIRGRVDQLLIDTGRLEQEIDQLHTDSVLIETLARQNLGMVRPGDIVISLRMEQPSSATLMADREGATESPSTGHLGSPALNSQHSKPVREGLVGTAIGGRP
jgi:cell division protein FtsB